MKRVVPSSYHREQCSPSCTQDTTAPDPAVLFEDSVIHLASWASFRMKGQWRAIRIVKSDFQSSRTHPKMVRGWAQPCYMTQSMSFSSLFLKCTLHLTSFSSSLYFHIHFVTLQRPPPFPFGKNKQQSSHLDIKYCDHDFFCPQSPFIPAMPVDHMPSKWMYIINLKSSHIMRM